MPTEEERAAMARRRGQLARHISDSKKQREFISQQGEEERRGKPFEDIERSTDAFETGLALRGSMHEGGEVASTGMYLLKKGEQVMTPKQKRRGFSARFHGKG